MPSSNTTAADTSTNMPTAQHSRRISSSDLDYDADSGGGGGDNNDHRHRSHRHHHHHHAHRAPMANTAAPASTATLPTVAHSIKLHSASVSQIRHIQNLLKEEQLLLRQEKKSIAQSVQVLNSLRFNIPLVMRQTKNITEDLHTMRQIDDDNVAHTPLMVPPLQQQQTVAVPPLSTAEVSVANTLMSSPRKAKRALNSIMGVMGRRDKLPQQQQQQHTQPHHTKKKHKQNTANEDDRHGGNVSHALPTLYRATTARNQRRLSKDQQASTDRIYKYSDRDHPLGVMKAKFEQVVDFIRVNPHLLAKSCKNLVIMSQQQQSTANAGSMLPHQQISDMVHTLVFCLYGNLANPVEDKLLRRFIRTCIDTAFKYCCTSPMEIFNNALIRQLLLGYVKRKGAGFIKYIMKESMSEILQRDDFDVRLEHLKPPQQDMQGPSSSSSPSTPLSHVSEATPQFTPSSSSTLTSEVDNASSSLAGDPTMMDDQHRVVYVGDGPVSPGTPKRNREAVDKIINDVSQQSEETEEISVRVLENKSGPGEAQERQLRKNTANLYSICTQFMRVLSQSIHTIPHNVRNIMKYLYKPKKLFSKTSELVRRQILKRYFISYYMVPLMTDPECVGFNEYPIVHEKREMLCIVALVLQNCALDIKFDANSPFASMNLFIDQNKDLMDKLFTDLVNVPYYSEEGDDDVDPKQIGALLNKSISRLFHFSSSSVQSGNIGEAASHLSPICLSNSENDYVLSILNLAPTKYRRRIPEEIRDAMKEIESWKSLYHSSHMHAHDKLSVMSMHEASISEYLPDVEEYTREFSTDNVKYLIQQILTSIGYVDQNSHHNEKFEHILQTLLFREKMQGNLSTASTIQELLDKLNMSTSNNSNVFDELQQEILSRRRYVHVMTENHKALLREIDILEEQVQFLNDEKDRYEMARENERLRSFFQQLQESIDKDLLQELDRAPFLEDQDRRILNFYNRTKQRLFQHIKHQFTLSPVEIERIYDRLKYFIMMKANPVLMNEHSIYFQKDRMLREKISQFRELTPEHLEIKPVYVSRCNVIAAQEEMKKLNLMCTAEGKLECITHCCMALIEVMRITHNRYPSVDDFLPILIYNVIKANPPHLLSNVKYIERFIDFFSSQRERQSMNDFAGDYYVRHFEAAVLFLEQVEIDSLLSMRNMDKKTKKKNASSTGSSTSPSQGMTESLRRIKEEEEQRRQQQQQQQQQYYARERDEVEEGVEEEDGEEKEADEEGENGNIDHSTSEEQPQEGNSYDPIRSSTRSKRTSAGTLVVESLRQVLDEAKMRSPDEYSDLLHELRSYIVDHTS